ncbi:nuclear autoantigen Sp-100 [Mesocricetus auratus]|uniref:Nuclear autoantigen Sp-100 n=1 Tax=Mesocricetus auratus TaxID=10036 RepID=A0ABM2Y2H7_MESAU|nr:nuclear autoantigen Sp-100 [Mesocricetus auratus]
MSTEQDTQNIAFEHIFLHFKRHKVAISTAIKKPFPFLEFLRDNELITNKMYDDFQDSCANLVPLQRVVYRALEELEKRLDMVVLGLLFSDENMKAYPDLELIFQSFQNVLQNKLCSQGSDRGDPNSQLSLDQGPGDSCSQGSLTWSPSDPSSSDGWRMNGTKDTTLAQENQIENHQYSSLQIHNVISLCENGLSEDLYGKVQIDQGRRDTTGDNTDGLERDQAAMCQGPDSEPEESCELEVHQSNRPQLRSQGTQVYPCSMKLGDIKQENSSFVLDSEETKPRTSHNQASEVIDLSIEDSDDGINCSEESTSGICQSEPVDSRKSPTLRKTCMKRDTSNTESSGARKRLRKIREKKEDSHGKYLIRNIKIPVDTSFIKGYTMRRINSSSQRGRKRGPRIRRQFNVNFVCPELPVTCGTAKGTLYKEKFEQGIHAKSIRSETGRWFTPMKFEIKGNRGDSKNWRQSIRCYGWPLKELIEDGYLPDPPRKRGKKGNPPNRQRTRKKLENSKQCTVCGQRRRLYQCAICSKFYHKRCHIPPVEVKSGLWNCVFCMTKDQLRCQENRAHHKESEVLRREMLPEEQLKCELLLLTIYCHSKSRFFIPKPKQRKEDFPDLQEHMWLNKIKYRLNKKAYHSVQHFVKDMRLIFRNHSIFYNNHKFSYLGVTVGELFEKTFKRIFSIKDASK